MYTSTRSGRSSSIDNAMSVNHADRCVGQRNVQAGDNACAFFATCPFRLLINPFDSKASGSRLKTKTFSQLIDESIFSNEPRNFKRLSSSRFVLIGGLLSTSGGVPVVQPGDAEHSSEGFSLCSSTTATFGMKEHPSLTVEHNTVFVLQSTLGLAAVREDAGCLHARFGAYLHFRRRLRQAWCVRRDEPIRVCYGTRIAKPMRPWRRSGAATATRDRPIEVHEPNSISRP